MAADKTHRGYAIIEQVHADLKGSAVAHPQSGVFNAQRQRQRRLARAGRDRAFNLTRAAATLAGHTFAKATTGTIRRKLIAVPACVATSARRVSLHLPVAWPWQEAWTELFTRVCGPPPTATS